MTVGMDISQLSDKALTGIPLYIDSLLREFLPGPNSVAQWTLLGSHKHEELKALLAERGIAYDAPNCTVLASADYRILERFPSLGKTDAMHSLLRKVDGRILSPLGQFVTARTLPPMDVFHHTSVFHTPPEAGRRNIVTIYDLTTRFFPETHHRSNIVGWERVFAWGRDHADLVITDSESARDDVIEHLNIAPERVRAIPLAARALPPLTGESEAAARQKWNLGAGRFVLAAGSLDPRKNLPRLIEAFARLGGEKEFADVRLLLTGAPLNGAGGVADAIETHKLGGRVVPTGYVSDEELAALMALCDAFIYPSVYEGFGLPVLEAMTMGAAVITSNVSSLPEVAGDAALLLDPKSTDEIEDALRRVLSDKSLSDDLRRRGRERAKAFSWKRCAEAHLRAYKDVTEA